MRGSAVSNKQFLTILIYRYILSHLDQITIFIKRHLGRTSQSINKIKYSVPRISSVKFPIQEKATKRKENFKNTTQNF